jgi:hypothetical protein
MMSQRFGEGPRGPAAPGTRLLCIPYPRNRMGVRWFEGAGTAGNRRGGEAPWVLSTAPTEARRFVGEFGAPLREDVDKPRSVNIQRSWER